MQLLRSPPGVRIGHADRPIGPGGAGIVDQDAQRAESCACSGHCSRNRARIGHVGCNRERRAAPLGNTGGDGIDVGTGAREQRDRRALAGQSFGDRAADAAASAGNERWHAGQCRHDRISCRVAPVVAGIVETLTVQYCRG
jgi:hypothetical protein